MVAGCTPICALLVRTSEALASFGLLASDAQSHSGAVTDSTPTVGYTYDPTNGDRLTSMTYPNGPTIGYNYSGLDSDASRISSISDENGLIQSYQYQGLDTPMVSTSGNGVVGTTVLDSLGRTSSITYTNSSGGVIDGFAYQYDNDGNVTSKTNLALSSLSETYGYDGLNRLTSFTRGTTTTESWNYDALGNWKSNTLNGVTTSRTNNAQNQATQIGSATQSYDADGNTLSNQVSGQTYVYDAWNRLVKVMNASGTVIASYTYDALGRRVTQTEGGTTTDLYYSGSDQVIEEQQNGVTTAQYVWSPFYVNQLVERDTYVSGVFSYRLYAQEDADYNITSLTDASGNVVQRFVYDPYGTQTVLSASGSSSSNIYEWFVGDQGGFIDPISGLVHFDARDLDTLTGQWNEEDPTGGLYVNGLDLYQDEDSNSVDSFDPTGLESPPAFSPPTVTPSPVTQGGPAWTPDPEEFGSEAEASEMLLELAIYAAAAKGYINLSQDAYYLGQATANNSNNSIPARQYLGLPPAPSTTTLYGRDALNAAKAADALADAAVAASDQLDKLLNQGQPTDQDPPPANNNNDNDDDGEPTRIYQWNPKHPPKGSPCKTGISPAPIDGQGGLNNSVSVHTTSPQRVGRDIDGDPIVFKLHFTDADGTQYYHGYCPGWDNLTDRQKNALIDSGQFNRRGKPI